MERRCECRLAVELPGMFHIAEHAVKPMWFSQVSANGCRITGNIDGLIPGDEIGVDLGPVGVGSATVRWVKDKAVGVQFHVSLDLAIVEYLATFLTRAA